ncbi:PIG-L family deacetylase [Cellulomonas sp. 73-145]|uniref:PIG-L family deacetylase n=1 Tax=Cellulomonas sp. 73-145 TaxID=1895739 RepID=UPI000A49BFFA|nr:PIG-L family deacetylase [Cellulomonas sp. 73-145]
MTPPGAVASSKDVTGGLVAVHAHPDDETLATGALLAAFAGAGRPVTVVTATRGERGEVIGERLAHLEGDGPALAAHRETELAAALAALGVADQAFLDRLAPVSPRRYEDSGMVWTGSARAGLGPEVPAGAFVGVPLDEAAERLAGLLRRRRPDVVATYDPEGGYGHPDHVRAHQVTMRALELATGPAWSPVVLWRRAGRTETAAAAAALEVHGPSSDGLTLTDPAGETAALVVTDDAVHLAVDVRPVRDQVVGALRAHATQVQAVTPIDGDPRLVGAFALSNRILQPLLPHEGYEVAGGDPGAVEWPAPVRRRRTGSDGAPSTRR